VEALRLRVGEEEFFKRCDRFRGRLRELKQRWDNRLILEREPWGEAYLAGRLSVVCYLQAIGRLDGEVCTSAQHGNADIAKGVLALVYGANANHAPNVNDGNEESVLVEVVKLRDFPKMEVPSFVRLYRVHDEVGKIGEGFLYASQGPGVGYKLVPFFAYRERDPIIVLPNGVEGNVVEGRSEVVDNISDDKWNLGWKRAERGYLQKMLPWFSLTVHPDCAEFRIEKCVKDRLQIIDVAIGPLDL
jgi:hypothetical protein